MSYIIQDWASNVLFSGKTFPTFEDAWDYIYDQVPLEGDYPYDDYFVVEDGPKREKRLLDPNDPRQGLVLS